MVHSYASPRLVAAMLIANLVLMSSGLEASCVEEYQGETPPHRSRWVRHRHLDRLVGSGASEEEMIDAGRRLFADEQFEAATIVFRIALRNNPSSSAARFALGQSLFAREDYSGAAAMIREGLDIDPYWAKIDYSVYGLFDYPGDVDRQVRLLKDYLRDRADDRDALFMLGFFQYHLTRNAQARASFARLAGMSRGDSRTAFYERLLVEKDKMRAGKGIYGEKKVRSPGRRAGKRRSGKKAAPAPAAPAPSEPMPPPPGAEAAPVPPPPGAEAAPVPPPGADVPPSPTPSADVLPSGPPPK